MRAQLGVVVAAVVVCLVAAPVGKAPIEPGSVFGAWLFDEEDANDATDWSANGRHGDVSGDAVVVEGVFGSALEFDGDGDNIVVPEVGDVLPEKHITVVAWIKNGAVAQNRHFLDVTPAEPGRLAIWMPADKQIFWHYGLGTQIILFKEAEWVGEWLHFAFISDSIEDFMITYLNGEKLQRAGRISGVFSPREADLLIGGLIGSTFAGAIDEFAIFDAALSQEDVQTIVAEGLGRAALGFAVDPAGKAAATWANLKAQTRR